MVVCSSIFFWTSFFGVNKTLRLLIIVLDCLHQTPMASQKGKNVIGKNAADMSQFPFIEMMMSRNYAKFKRTLAETIDMYIFYMDPSFFLMKMLQKFLSSQEFSIVVKAYFSSRLGELCLEPVTFIQRCVLSNEEMNKKTCYKLVSYDDTLFLMDSLYCFLDSRRAAGLMAGAASPEKMASDVERYNYLVNTIQINLNACMSEVEYYQGDILDNISETMALTQVAMIFANEDRIMRVIHGPYDIEHDYHPKECSEGYRTNEIVPKCRDLVTSPNEICNFFSKLASADTEEELKSLMTMPFEKMRYSPSPVFRAKSETVQERVNVFSLTSCFDYHHLNRKIARSMKKRLTYTMKCHSMTLVGAKPIDRKEDKEEEIGESSSSDSESLEGSSDDDDDNDEDDDCEEFRDSEYLAHIWLLDQKMCPSRGAGKMSFYDLLRTFSYYYELTSNIQTKDTMLENSITRLGKSHLRSAA